MINESERPTAQSLAAAKCVPCEGGVDKLTGEQADSYAQATPEWELDAAASAISRKINCKNFVRAVELVNRIAEVAETQQHHPDLHLTGYRHLKVVLTTHAIGGLSENDFILAAQIDQLLANR
ncbi:4a-hydroxytetrahydrobiopterin dehydratase [Stieleria sp. TO1_6]|uniref:4a-hydroxytetrahydrobiopterin dehydratase n=1 Tax=Stieleria tagensis TaxID=2956795 RepID=UPI00209B71E9|nr:4a-hydroxytetrahydrobiopterin dehydratase [Stieleria tagensis]MCO8122072.1 4a-hydroxytetrahydrobiopterin dehydratase [Stieleria tagensis]